MTRTTSIGSNGIGIKIKVSPTTLLLLIVSFKSRLPKKTSVMETVREAIQPLRSTPLK